MGGRGPAHRTGPVGELAGSLPRWVSLQRAPNPGLMTLDGTNTWLLRAPGAARGIVIDPGPKRAEHLAAIAERAPIALILVTHGHADHVEGARALSERLGGALVLAVDPAHCVGVDPLTIGPGEVVSVPDLLPTGSDQGLASTELGLTIQAVGTPGHTSDSVCFVAEHGGERVVFTGDTILGRGTTVVAWPDGDLGDYLSSLELLSAYRRIPALPGHGPALADVAVAARTYLDHRAARLEQVREVVRAGATTAAEVVARVYPDVDRSLWWAAEWSVEAQLAYLRRELPAGSTGLDPP